MDGWFDGRAGAGGQKTRRKITLPREKKMTQRGRATEDLEEDALATRAMAAAAEGGKKEGRKLIACIPGNFTCESFSEQVNLLALPSMPRFHFPIV